MIHAEKTANWTKEHFVTYVYLCVAGADYSVDEEEIKEIHDKVIETLGSEDDFNKVIGEVQAEIKDHNDKDRMDFISDNVGTFLPSQEERKQVLEGIEDVIVADGHVDSVEMVTYRFVKKALNP